MIINMIFVTVSRKLMLDDALVNMIVKDVQPFTLVEDDGFKAFVHLLDPTYNIPGRKALKRMVEAKYKATKEEAMAEVRKASAVSLTADMWTSMNMDAYLAVTCHYITDQAKLSTVLLGVGKFTQSHTAAHLAEVKHTLMVEWGIRGKVRSLVTDCAANMIASANLLSVRHVTCFPHVLNLVVKRSLSQTPELEEIRTRARRIVGHFKSSTKAKEKLSEMQVNMGRKELKMIQEVDTRWNSVFAMLDRLYNVREPLGAALTTLSTDLSPITAEDYETIRQCLAVLKPFNQATVELSEEKRVSGSKVIPLIKMLKHTVVGQCAQIRHNVGAKLATNLKNNLLEKFNLLEKISTLSVATLLDPRFKAAGFCSATCAQGATERLTRECAHFFETDVSEGSAPQESAATPGTLAQEAEDNLWALLDCEVGSQQVTNPTASATVEVQGYSISNFIVCC